MKYNDIRQGEYSEIEREVKVKQEYLENVCNECIWDCKGKIRNEQRGYTFKICKKFRRKDIEE